jgi:hypothetical protein
MSIIKKYLYLELDNKNIKNAVSMWCINKNEALKIYGHISSWDTRQVTSMRGLFSEFSMFIDDISKWNVANVKDMSLMFYYASSYNQFINEWDVANVQNMNYVLQCIFF